MLRTVPVACLCLFWLGILTPYHCSRAQGSDNPKTSGVFATQATRLTQVYVAHSADVTITVVSPDGRSQVEAKMINSDKDNEKFVLDVAGDIGSRRFEIAYGPNAEVLWSPDSKALFVTENDGGAVGGFLLSVLGRFNGQLTAHKITSLISKAFGHPVRCFYPEPPNVAGLTWLGSWDHLVAVAEIEPHSNCDSMGTFKAYEINPVRMRIIRRYGQLEAKKKFAPMLGPELRNADDECAEDPKICYIPQLHTGTRQSKQH